MKFLRNKANRNIQSSKEIQQQSNIPSQENSLREKQDFPDRKMREFKGFGCYLPRTGCVYNVARFKKPIRLERKRNDGTLYPGPLLHGGARAVA